ncbi:hypothetical protein B9Z55_022131 [Caenorhabditis nigoni]|uniref:Serpentine receptor class gamma n=2 Tax=Caenorhabditis nigoni TaxID=1611254 RepID=A0A2G5TVZ8_9PELO|nr:hypothetical protein B9Z55_022131 [Caenorhabditis nigoni]
MIDLLLKPSFVIPFVPECLLMVLYHYVVHIVVRNRSQFKPSFVVLIVLGCIMNTLAFGNSFITARVPRNTAENDTFSDFFKSHDIINDIENFSWIQISHTLHYSFAYSQYFYHSFFCLNRFIGIVFPKNCEKIWKKSFWPVVIIIFFVPILIVHRILFGRSFYRIGENGDFFWIDSTYSRANIYTIMVPVTSFCTIFNISVNIICYLKMRRKERAFHARLLNEILNGKYLVTTRIFHSLDTFVYRVSDLNSSEQLAMKMVRVNIFEDVGFYNEMEFFRNSKNINGIPRLVDQFYYMDQFACMVMTISGRHLGHHLLRLRGRAFDEENTLRIGWRLFHILCDMHEKGYVHGKVNSRNVLVEIGWSGEIELTLIDFSHTVEIKDSPNIVSEPCPTVWHSSISVMTGNPYTIYDDFVSMVFLLMDTQDINPMGNDPQLFPSLKQAFHENPMEFFDEEETEWIGVLYKEFENQRTTGFDRAKIETIFSNALTLQSSESTVGSQAESYVNPRSHITYYKNNGSEWIY